MTNIVIEKRSLWSALALVATVAFSWLQIVGYLGPGFEEIFSLEPKAMSINQIALTWVPIISYVLIATIIALAVNIFKPLKPMSEDGLIRSFAWGLIGGFVFGFIVGFIFGLIAGFVFGFSVGLLTALIWGLIVGYIVGFIAAFIWSLIIGFNGEFA